MSENLSAWERRKARGWVRKSRPKSRDGYQRPNPPKHSEGYQRPRRYTIALGDREFVGVDGEGGDDDELGRQKYMYLHASDNIASFSKGIESKSRLSSEEIFEFLLSMPRHYILTGFFIGYDIQHWLIDLPTEKIRQIMDESREGNKWGQRTFTYWKTYGISHVPRQFFNICRLIRDDTGKSGFKVVKNSVRTVNETWGFFQSNFVNTLRIWTPEKEEIIARIERMKSERQTFTEMTQEIRDYCAEECALLAETMTRLRKACFDADIIPSSWRGAGHLATALYRQNNEPVRPAENSGRKIVRPERPNRLELAAISAYYGGRFEVSTIGDIGTLHEYDINSAYPYALATECVCPNHTTYTRISGLRTPRNLPKKYLAFVQWDLMGPTLSGTASYCPFPIRLKNGRVIFPAQGRGWYWYPEVNAALKHCPKGSIIIKDLWAVNEDCTCDFYHWVRRLYEYRKSIGKAGKGYVIKLGLNALAGKKMQKIGAAPYQDWINAGIITATTRAMVYDAAMLAHPNAVMIATDGVYSRVEIPNLITGENLGQWEHKILENGHIVQPGLYWDWNDKNKVKSRGLAKSIALKSREIFYEYFHRSIATGTFPDIEPVPAPVHTHISHSLALARNKPFEACKWAYFDKFFRYDIGSKRSIEQGDALPGPAYYAPPLPGNPALETVSGEIEQEINDDFERFLFDGADDFVHIS